MPMTPEQRGVIGLIFLILAALGAAALVNKITNNATVAFPGAAAVFSFGLTMGDKLIESSPDLQHFDGDYNGLPES